MAKLYLVPTPIGNLEDMTFRAIRILKEVNLILAEDTRTSQKLLMHYDIRNSLQSHHQFNEHKTAQHVAGKILSGMDVALITDAGTPGISDPGFLLVRQCIEIGVDVECLPGATAFVPALAQSGLPCDRFIFEGFLPHKKGRQTRVKKIVDNEYTSVLYESPFRLIKTLEQLAEYAGNDRKVCVCRELSKMFEENIRGTLPEAIAHFKTKAPKGEIVIILAGKNQKENPEEEQED